jgi:hypothetical protein
VSKRDLYNRMNAMLEGIEACRVEDRRRREAAEAKRDEA